MLRWFDERVTGGQVFHLIEMHSIVIIDDVLSIGSLHVKYWTLVARHLFVSAVLSLGYFTIVRRLFHTFGRIESHVNATVGTFAHLRGLRQLYYRWEI